MAHLTHLLSYILMIEFNTPSILLRLCRKGEFENFFLRATDDSSSIAPVAVCVFKTCRKAVATAVHYVDYGCARWTIRNQPLSRRAYSLNHTTCTEGLLYKYLAKQSHIKAQWIKKVNGETSSSGDWVYPQYGSLELPCHI